MKAEPGQDRLKQATETVSLCREKDDQLALAQALERLGYVERQLTLVEAAQRHYEEAATIYRQKGDVLALAHTVRHLGDIHRNAGRLDLAEPHYHEALEIYHREPGTKPLDLANAVRGMALLKGDTGDFDQAKLLWREARDLYLTLSVEVGVTECDRRLSMLDEEIFDVVNERDEVVGQSTRREVHARGLLHRAVHVLVFGADGRIFLQKRSMTKDTFPGAWDSSASGHVDSGEDYDACAVRELQEELGLTVAAPPRRLFKIEACAETGHEFVWVYRLESDGPFALHPEEIERGDWFGLGQVTDWIAQRPQEFAASFVLIWKNLTEGGAFPNLPNSPPGAFRPF